MPVEEIPMKAFLLWLGLAGSPWPQDSIPAETEAKNRAAARLEQRFAALPPFAAEYQAVNISPDGKEDPGSEFLVWSDYLGMSLRSRTKVMNADGSFSIVYSIIEKDQIWFWQDGKNEGYWADLSDYFLAIRSAVDMTERELDRILPRTSEDPDPALCSGLQIVLDVLRKKSAEDENGGLFNFSISIMTSPASWLAEARGTREARMTEGESSTEFILSKEGKTIVVDKETGVLIRIESKDYDGLTRRLVRRSFLAKCEAPEFQRPKQSLLKPFPLGTMKGYVEAYRQAITLAGNRMLRDWGRLGEHQAGLPNLFAEWSARYLGLWQMVFLDSAADGYIKERLNGGEKLDALERDVGQEARRMGERLAKDGQFSGICRQLLKDYLDPWERSFESHPDLPNGEPFMKTLRAGASPERVFPKIEKVRETDFRRALQGALKRARQL